MDLKNHICFRMYLSDLYQLLLFLGKQNYYFVFGGNKSCKLCCPFLIRVAFPIRGGRRCFVWKNILKNFTGLMNFLLLVLFL